MTDPTRVLELRRELAELGDPEPGTADLAAATRASILAELADLGAPAIPAADAPRPLHLPVRVQAHHPAPRALPASSHPLPATPAAPEPPMLKTTPPPLDPRLRLNALLERLAHNEETKNVTAASVTRSDIRKHCRAHGLAVPEAARARTMPKPTAAQRPRLPKAAKPSPEIPPIGPEDERFPVGRLKPSARIRALRSQALEMLPEMEDLSPEEAVLAHDEMDLLAKVLVLGGQLIARRTA